MTITFHDSEVRIQSSKSRMLTMGTGLDRARFHEPYLDYSSKVRGLAFRTPSPAASLTDMVTCKRPHHTGASFFDEDSDF